MSVPAPLPAPAGPTLGRRPRAGRFALRSVGAALGVVASALAFSALWPADAPGPGPSPLPAGDAAAARAVVAHAQRLVSITPAYLGYTLRVAGPLPGIRGQIDNAERTITLFVSPNDTPSVVAHDLGHELGHAFDARHLTPARRAAYLRSRRAEAAPWSPGAQASDYRSGAGDFAEVFALCHAASPIYRSRLAPRPADACSILPEQARSP